MKNIEIEKLTHFFKVLSNPVRLKVLMHIAQCKDHCHKHNISELSKNCDVDFSVVSRHLKALKDLEILEAHKDKNDVIYTFNRKKFKKDLEFFCDKF